MGYFVIIQGNFSATKQICTFQIVLCFVDHLFLYMSEKSPSDLELCFRRGMVLGKGTGKEDFFKKIIWKTFLELLSPIK